MLANKSNKSKEEGEREAATTRATRATRAGEEEMSKSRQRAFARHQTGRFVLSIFVNFL